MLGWAELEKKFYNLGSRFEDLLSFCIFDISIDCASMRGTGENIEVNDQTAQTRILFSTFFVRVQLGEISDCTD